MLLLLLSACVRSGYEDHVRTPGVDGGQAGAGSRAEGGRDGGAQSLADATAGEPSGGATYRKRLSVGPGVGAELRDFPVAVVLQDDADLRARVARADGGDIYFTSADGTRLPHELEAFDRDAGDLLAWVRCPVLRSANATPLDLYYGNANAGAPEARVAAQVWSADFVAVYHLASTLDSTGNGHDATPMGEPRLAADGMLGGGAALDGDDGFDVGDVDALDGIARMSVSAWVRMDALSDVQTVATKLAPGATQGWGLASGRSGTDLEGNNDIAFAVGPVGPSGAGDVTTTNVIVGGRFRHWAAVFDGTAASVDGKLRIYIDGEEVATTPYGDAATVPSVTPATNDPLYIGSSPIDSVNWLRGMLDEVRLSSAARSGAWVATEYRNQRDPRAFVSVGPQETL